MDFFFCTKNNWCVLSKTFLNRLKLRRKISVWFWFFKHTFKTKKSNSADGKYFIFQNTDKIDKYYKRHLKHTNACDRNNLFMSKCFGKCDDSLKTGTSLTRLLLHRETSVFFIRVVHKQTALKSDNEISQIKCVPCDLFNRSHLISPQEDFLNCECVFVLFKRVIALI